MQYGGCTVAYALCVTIRCAPASPTASPLQEGIAGADKRAELSLSVTARWSWARLLAGSLLTDAGRAVETALPYSVQHIPSTAHSTYLQRIGQQDVWYAEVCVLVACSPGVVAGRGRVWWGGRRAVEWWLGAGCWRGECLVGGG